MRAKPVLMAAAAVIAVTAAACSAPPATSSVPGSGLPQDYSHPFGPHEKQVTLAQAAASAGYSVTVPTAALANAETLTTVWVSPAHQVALVFDHGKITVMMAPAIYHDPLSFFRKSLKGMNGKSQITQVNGQPMLVSFPHTDPLSPNPAWVEFDQNGVDTNIVSQTYGTATLLAIARTMT
ncbi:MAG TPA: hypothetical protein VGS19_26915 [Streptosporangiaceae bacterium]|nr:hypothetical protein [Streptosporangiaceae bacterium]